jgi:hypothetical protein
MPDYWLPQYTWGQQQDVSDYIAVRSYESAWEALGRAVRESKPVLKAAFGRELRDTAVKQCRKMASDWHGDPYRQDFQEYVSVAAVWACGKAAEGTWVAGMRLAVASTSVKNAILAYVHGERPMEYGCGPDVWQKSNINGSRVWESLHIRVTAPVGDGDGIAPLDLQSQRQGGYGRTRGAGRVRGDAIQHLANDDAAGIDQEQLDAIGWTIETALDTCAEDDPDGVAAFRALYMTPSFPGAENALPGSYTRREMAEDLGVKKDTVATRADRIGKRLQEMVPSLLSVWQGRTISGRRQVIYDPASVVYCHRSTEGFGGEIPCPGAGRVVNGRRAFDSPQVLLLARRMDETNPVTVTTL